MIFYNDLYSFTRTHLEQTFSVMISIYSHKPQTNALFMMIYIHSYPYPLKRQTMISSDERKNKESLTHTLKHTNINA